MRIAIAGASGLIGSALAADLISDGHEVIRLVRREAESPDEISWDPQAGTVEPGLEGTDAIVNLSGANIGGRRWTKAYKQEILDSRVLGTTTLTKAVSVLDRKPAVFVNASAIGYYGDAGPAEITESSAQGEGFLADVVEAWESATTPAKEAGIRVVYARTGLVISREGGAFARLMPIFKYGLGGRVGSGQQYWSFISLRDEVSALKWCIRTSHVSGPVNIVAPQPITNADITAALADYVRRPAFLPVPALALKAAFGEFADDILASQRVLPMVLKQGGFEWRDPTIEQALTATEES